jgi:hypothetical protein
MSNERENQLKRIFLESRGWLHNAPSPNEPRTMRDPLHDETYEVDKAIMVQREIDGSGKITGS